MSMTHSWLLERFGHEQTQVPTLEDYDALKEKYYKSLEDNCLLMRQLNILTDMYIKSEKERIRLKSKYEGS